METGRSIAPKLVLREQGPPAAKIRGGATLEYFPVRAGRAAALLTLLLIAAATAAATARAQSYDELPPDLDARAQGLYKAIMCPQCAGQSIDQSNAPLAKTMRQTIRDQLAAGATNDEIVDLLVSAYGEGVLASPPTRGFSLAAWAAPPVAILFGAAAVACAVRSLRRRADADASRAPDDSPADELESYLDIVDRELAGGAPGSSGGNG